MKREDIDRWVRYELDDAEHERRQARGDLLAFGFFCGAVVLVVVIAELLAA